MILLLHVCEIIPSVEKNVGYIGYSGYLATKVSLSFLFRISIIVFILWRCLWQKQPVAIIILNCPIKNER